MAVKKPAYPDTWEDAYSHAVRTGNAGIGRASRKLPATADVADAGELPKKLLPGRPLPVKQSRTEPLPAPASGSGSGENWLYPAGVGMVAMTLLWLIGSAIVGAWQGMQDDLHYGRPRTYQTDVRIGHGDDETPSHFIATNNNGRILVVEFPGNDARKTKVYAGPQLGPGQDLTPVTLEFRDVTSDGKPDMLINAGQSRTILVNDGSSFRTPKTNEVQG